MTVLDTLPELLRMATVACASTSAGDPPIVCASHSDQLPAGASAAAAAAESTAPESDGLGPWYLALGVGLLLAALAVVLVTRRRRSLSWHERNEAGPSETRPTATRDEPRPAR